MANSGLSAALATVYGQEPMKKIKNGKSYYGAIRAHNLASTALNEILLEYVEKEDRMLSRLPLSCLCHFKKIMIPLDAGALKDSLIVQNLIEVVGRTEKDLSLGTNMAIYSSSNT